MIALKPTLVNLAMMALKSFLADAKKKDKSNAGPAFAEWYFWNELSKLAENKAETIRDRMIADELLKDPKSFEEAGTFEMGECNGFICTVAVTGRVKVFNPMALAVALNKSHKIPVPVVIGAVDSAKIETNPRRTIKIIER